MKQRGGISLVLVITWIGALALTGCQDSRIIVANHPPVHVNKPGPPPWAPAHGYRAKHHYRYYPSSCVYYDVARGVYFYYDGHHWKASVSLPLWIHVNVGEYVTLDMDTKRPYEYHSEVVKRYPPGKHKQKHKGKGKKKWS